MRFFKKEEENIVDLTNYNNQENWPLDSSDIEISSEDVLDLEKPTSPEDRKKKFAKRITKLTKTTEDLATQIYHLQQRVELLERKANINRD